MAQHSEQSVLALPGVAAAMQRVESLLRQRPEAGLHDDAPATARWESGTRVTASHAAGTHISTDMPTTFGGSGDKATPGWLFRAGLASCAATTIAMTAAARHIELTRLEVHASSCSDTRGLLGMADADGRIVSAAPCNVELVVRIAARGASADGLRSLVEESYRCSPIPSAVQSALPVALRIDVEADDGTPKTRA